MRIAIAAAFFAAACGTAGAEYYVVQDTQTKKCSIEQSVPESSSTQILLNNKFNERADAEAAMRDVPICN